MLAELFEGLQELASSRHGDLALHLELACKSWVKAYPRCGEDAIGLMGKFIPMLGLIGRNFDIIIERASIIMTLVYLWNRLNQTK
ncbi:MAG: hypothetical protein IPO85_13990 [Saprospiraceae bacterium]|uniref:Uncharacterized protein n=1 Tax=Candidatus Defluviibacterium haderslevense TaxID=2981993 RepID=A0A9D7SA53_9BACT|nr:hypothetical protein [Candidatus Defluviibacterium haderslevense]